MPSREGQVEPPDKGIGLGRTAKMARVGRKYATLFELAALPTSKAEPVVPCEWASRVLRLLASASWADPVFLEELCESGLVPAICKVHPLLKANATGCAASSSIQDSADLDEAVRKLRHELGLAEKRLPSHGNLGSGGSAFYTTWTSVGHVCSLMLQALTHAGAAQTPNTPASANAGGTASTAATHSQQAPATNGPTAATQASTSGAVGSSAPNSNQAPDPETQEGPANDTSAAAHAAPARAEAGGAASGAVADTPGDAGPSNAATPRGHPGSTAKALSGLFASPPGTAGGVSSGSGGGGSMPALATEAALLKLLGHKHVLPRAKDVLRAVSEPYRAVLARILLTHMMTEMKATKSGLATILQILKGDPEASSPAPTALPKAWFASAALLTAYRDVLSACAPPAPPSAEAAAGPSTSAAAAAPAAAAASSGAEAPELAAGQATASSEAEPLPPAGAGRTAGEAAGEAEHSAAPNQASGGGASAAVPQPATEAQQQAEAAAAADGSGDVPMADAQPAPQPEQAAAPAPNTGSAPTGLDSAPPPSFSASLRSELPSLPAPATLPAASAPESRGDDARFALGQLLEDMAVSLLDAVSGAHAVGRMALLLRGEAAAKFPAAASFMPAALSINELIAHLDALACVGAALGAEERVRPAAAALLSGPAVRELLGVGKVYVTTVIAAGALTRDLSIEAVIPQSLRQGYMAAVLTPLETGALLNERRAPQVLAYRNSITESSYYQVMDADALPYGVNIRFEDEQEAEGMGVVREWLSQIAADIFSTERGLFVRGAADRRVVHPSPQSAAQEDYLGYMRFAGRIVGLALRANVPLGVVLSTGLFKYLTGRRANLQDLQQIDPQLYTTCQNILSTPGAESLELFHVWHRHGGPMGQSPSGGSHSKGGEQQQQRGAEVEVELLPGGSSLRVCDANKAAYVELLAHHVVVEAVEEQSAAFLAGLQDTAAHLPEEPRLRRAFLSPLLLEDLNRITAGESRLEPDDWAAHTDVAGFEGGEEQSCLDMFWQLVAEYSPEDRQRLLQFWTAMTHLPSGGFKALNQRLQIMKLGPSAARPAAATAAGPAGAAAAAATPAAAAMHGAPAESLGPHSHQLDGDALEGEEPSSEDSEESMEEAAAEPSARTPPPQQQQQQQEEGERQSDAATAAAAAAGAATGVPDGNGGEGGHAARAAEPGADGAAAAAAAQSQPQPPQEGEDAAAQPLSGFASGDVADEDGEMPYDEGYDDEEEDDGMDYGHGEDEVDEEEEFQRQLEMALALSLQDLPAEQANTGAGPSGQQPAAPAPADGAAGGAAGGSSAEQPASSGNGADDSGGADGAGNGGSGPTGASPGGEAANGGSAGKADGGAADGTAPAAAAAAPAADLAAGDGGMRQQDAEATDGQPQQPAEEGVSDGAAGLAHAGSSGEAGMSSEAAMETTGAEAAATVAAAAAAAPVAAVDGQAREGTSPGGGGDTTAAGTDDHPSEAETSDMPREKEATNGVSTLDAAAAADTDGAHAGPGASDHLSAAAAPHAGEPATGPAAAAAGDAANDSAAAAADAPNPAGDDTHASAQLSPPDGVLGGPVMEPPSDPMDTEVASGAAAGPPDGSAAAASPWAEPGQSSAAPGAQAAEMTEAAMEGIEQQEQHQEQEPPQGQPQDQQADQGHHQQQQQLPEQQDGQQHPEPLSEQQPQGMQEEPQQQQPQEAREQAGSDGGAMDAEAMVASEPQQQQPGGLQEAAASTAAAVAAAAGPSRGPPLLPQARTCFLQLNLPVYTSMEDMRRAFAIALDNMSFGLH